MGVLLILFLSMYTWNKNTHVLDDFSTDVGLELTGGVITPIRYVCLLYTSDAADD